MARVTAARPAPSAAPEPRRIYVYTIAFTRENGTHPSGQWPTAIILNSDPLEAVAEARLQLMVPEGSDLEPSVIKVDELTPDGARDWGKWHASAPSPLERAAETRAAQNAAALADLEAKASRLRANIAVAPPEGYETAPDVQEPPTPIDAARSAGGA